MIILKVSIVRYITVLSELTTYQVSELGILIVQQLITYDLNKMIFTVLLKSSKLTFDQLCLLPSFGKKLITCLFG